MSTVFTEIANPMDMASDAEFHPDIPPFPLEELDSALDMPAAHRLPSQEEVLNDVTGIGALFKQL